MTLTHSQRRARRAEIAELVRGGMPTSEAANQFGMHTSSVIGACREHGVSLRLGRPSGRAKANTFEILADLLQSDASVRAIATARGVSYQWVFDILNRARRAGVRFPKRKERDA